MYNSNRNIQNNSFLQYLRKKKVLFLLLLALATFTWCVPQTFAAVTVSTSDVENAGFSVSLNDAAESILTCENLHYRNGHFGVTEGDEFTCEVTQTSSANTFTEIGYYSSDNTGRADVEPANSGATTYTNDAQAAGSDVYFKNVLSSGQHTDGTNIAVADGGTETTTPDKVRIRRTTSVQSGITIDTVADNTDEGDEHFVIVLRASLGLNYSEGMRIYVFESEDLTDFSVDVGDSKAKLTWVGPSASTVTGYDYSQDDGGSWIAIPDSDAGTASYTVADLTPGTAYTFKVRAKNGAVTVVTSEGIAATPNKIADGVNGVTLEDGDHFGSATAVSSDGTTLAVGADSDDTSGANAGAVHLFTRNNDVWLHEVTIDDDFAGVELNAEDYFGSSVALSSDGTTLAVGTPNSDYTGDINDLIDDLGNTGAVHLFTKSGTAWTYSTTIEHDTHGLSLAANDEFGYATTLSSDGNTLVVGAWKDDTGGVNRGAVHFFTKSGNTWTYSTSIDADFSGFTLGDADRFGSSTALSPDGNTLAVGAEYHGTSVTGGVHLFTKSSNVWSYSSVIDTTFTDLSLANNDRFGSSAAFSPDGNMLMVGAYGHNTDEGGIHFFNRDGAIWTYGRIIEDGSPAWLALPNGSKFGMAAALYTDDEDRTFLVGGLPLDSIGGTNRGAVAIIEVTPPEAPTELSANVGYDKVELTWTEPSGTITGYDYSQDDGGSWTAIPDSDADTTSYTVADLTPGASYTFKVRARNEGVAGISSEGIAATPNKIANGVNGITLEDSDLFGSSVTLSADRNTLIVGATGFSTFGGALLFTKNNGFWVYDAAVDTSDVGLFFSLSDKFGSSVALSPDGNTLIIGVRGDNNKGDVYIFTKSNNTWTYDQTASDNFPDSMIESLDGFGSSLALSSDGTTLYIGASGDDTGDSTDDTADDITNAGAVHIFTGSGTSWTHSTTIDGGFESVPLTSDDLFGTSITLSQEGGILAVGATGDRSDRGAVHLFTGSGTSWTYSATIDTDFSGFTLQDGDRFGSSVALSPDGDTFVVGAEDDETVYIFTKDDDDWVYYRTIDSSDSDVALNSDDRFGSSAVLFVHEERDLFLLTGANRDNTGGTARGAVHITDTGADYRIPGLSARSLSTGVGLLWTAPAEITADTYDYSPDDGETWTAIPNSDSTTTSYVITDTAPGVSYDFKIRTRNNSGEYIYSNTVTAAMFGPAVNVGYDQVRIKLPAPKGIAGVSSYQYRQDLGDWTDFPASDAATIEHSIENLTPGTSYTFTVRAMDEDTDVLITSEGVEVIPNKMAYGTSSAILNDEDEFGASTAVSPDGNTLVVGATHYDTASANTGAVHIFTKNNNVWSHEVTLKDTDFEDLSFGTNNFFGSAVLFSSDGNTLYVGSDGDNTGGSQRGAVYIFTKSDSVWSYSAALAHGSNGLTLENDLGFGSALALSPDESILTIGASKKESDGGANINTGAVYLMIKDADDNWEYSTIIENGFDDLVLANRALFGSSVTFSSDGDILMVGASGENTGGSKRGAVYSFTKGEDDSWSYDSAETIDSDTDDFTLEDNSRFGSSAALSPDGSRFYVGARGKKNDDTNRGSVHMFIRNNNAWIHSLTIDSLMPTLSYGETDSFGDSAALAPDGNTLFIGATNDGSGGVNRGAVHIVDSAPPSAPDLSVNVGYDSAQLAWTMPAEGDITGYEYSEDGGDTWIDTGLDGTATSLELTDLTPGTSYTFVLRAKNDYRIGDFSNKVAAVPNRIAHGVNGVTLGDYSNFGSTIVLSSDRNTLAVSMTGIPGSNTGGVYFFTRSDGVWVHDATIDSSFPELGFDSNTQPFFGNSMALSSDGNTIYISATENNAVYIFTKDGDSWSYASVIDNTHVGLNLDSGDKFGSSIALSPDGTVLYIGATADDTGDGTADAGDDIANAGAVHLFTGSGTSWTYGATIDGSFTDLARSVPMMHSDPQ